MGTKAATLATLALGFVAAARGDEAENRERLEAMPREQRLLLSKTLDEYDALPAPDRAAIRDLDAAISRLDPGVQPRYRLLLRRYHVWINGLDDAQRAQLAKAPSIESKLALVTRWRKQEREADTRDRKNMIFGVHPGELGILPPWEMAFALHVWFQLNERERAEVEKLERIPQRMEALRRLGRNKQIPNRLFPAKDEEAVTAQLQEDELIRSAFPRWIAKREKRAEPEGSKAEGGKKSAETAKVANPLHDPLHHLAESIYFGRNAPAAVTPDRLEQFDARIPLWLRATLDPLPPEDARRRLTILYRQIYPLPQEIPPPPKPDPAAAKAKPLAKPAATTPAPATSF